MTAAADLGVVVAFDHVFLGLIPELRDLDAAVERVVSAGPDGVVLQPGALKRLGPRLAATNVCPVLRLDGNRSHLAGNWTSSDEWVLFTTPEAALRWGAGAVIVNLVLGGGAELASLRVVSSVIEDCGRLGLPVLVSAMVARPDRPAGPQERVFAARLAEEMGADIVVLYDLPELADLAVVEEASRWCRQPLLAAGAGPDPELLSDWIPSAITAGARGFCLGRSVWGSDDPPKLVHSALAAASRGRQ